MIVQGALECMMGILYGAAAFMFPAMLQWMNDMVKMQPPPAGGPVPQMPEEMGWFIAVIYIVAGGATLLVGVLRIIAGIYNLRYQGRAFGIIALFLGVIPFITCYCAPTSLGLMIYGLIVYFNEQSARAFQLGAQGRTPAEIQSMLARENEIGPY
jgi:hypothetical protein